MNRELPNWSYIVEQNSRRVYAIAFRILGSVQDAEDVSQDVFLEAFQVFQKRQVKSWIGLLVRLATLRSIDRRRRRKPLSEFFEETGSVDSDPAKNLIEREQAESLRNAISTLPEQQSVVFAMTHFEELPRDEIASHLGITPESVSTSLYKAKQKLAEELAPLSKER